MAGKPSKVDKLPEGLREGIAQLWTSGRYTVDQILTHLHDLAAGRRTMLPPELDVAVSVTPEALPSRSRLHAHLQGVDQVADRLQRSRAVAEALVKKLGDEPESRTARLNIELLHSAVLDLFMAADEQRASDGGGSDDAPEGPPVPMTPETVMFLAKALKDLSSARKTDADLILRMRKEVAAEMIKKLDAAETAARAAGEKGLSQARIAQLRQVLAVGAV
ncbi:phage protein Gp27 family protein [Azospirillum halopraeferens]|uniref:phage protein Gp27 family protein n=1 Tax=Azospirillum halopraeferens TaxID=34010 RepID=UPI0004223518|nr:phage protein Gp27 family protein [Azospirillum halopraeferens]